MDCAKFRESISAYLDGEMDNDTLFSFRSHMERCADCKQELREYLLMQKAVKNMPNVCVPDNLGENIRQAVIKEQQKIKPIRSKRFLGIKVIAAAAAFLLVVGAGSWILKPQSNEQTLKYSATMDFAMENEIETASPDKILQDKPLLNVIGYAGPEEDENSSAVAEPEAIINKELAEDSSIALANVVLLVDNKEMARNALIAVANDNSAEYCTEENNAMFCMEIDINNYDSVYDDIAAMQNVEEIKDFISKDKMEDSQKAVLRIYLTEAAE